MTQLDPTRLVAHVRTGMIERNQVMVFLYKNELIKKTVVGTLVKMGCSPTNAQDLFTESIINFIKSCYKPDFQIRNSLTNYLTGTAKNIWLKEVTKNKNERTITKRMELESEQSIEIHLMDKERKQILQKVLNLLDETCRKVLNLWAIQKRMREIATLLSYKSEGMARKKKHQCLKKLYDIIHSNSGLLNDLRL